MKKNLFVLLFVAMLGIAFISPAFAEELVPPAPGVTKEEVVAAMSTEGKNIITGVEKSNKKFFEERDAKTANSVNALKETLDKFTKEGGPLAGVKNGQDTLNKKLLGDGKNKGEFELTRDTTVKVGKDLYDAVGDLITAMTIWIVIAIVLVGVGIIAFLFFRTEKKIGATQATETIITAVNVAADRVIADVPNETKNAIQQINSAPFLIDNLPGGHHVSYTSPKEAMEEGYYLTLKIEEMPDGKTSPQTFVRQAENKKWQAIKYVEGVMKKFLEGKLKGTPQETLIVYLRDVTQDITIT